MPKVKHEIEKCIGCASCEAIAPRFWEMKGDKSHLKGSKYDKDGNQILEIKEKDLQENQDAADSCPVNCIHILK